ncbi:MULTISPECIES: deoxyribose-phosphate aldolase [Carnobacterium]|jgi:deoxyribose-phosphate aldolase|uniref:Deoxyribose-phosphate aldolase n=2 Tax=Carnobacterium inhibens TaxID=147709 RepID=U5SCW6_9LACT|nr:deoxyribose-phosphate aldolase [Carnobacterium inhibens]AGY81672.1 deoxyribose-phosphate aldolase [Carnobacterium inhibens subsp. gilichinskyi]MBC9824828.1 deoxyribose-phosphate aldolase [Carnobacterium inhibens]
MTVQLNKTIDHTLLKPEATEAQIKTLCEEAAKYDFMSVCVNPTWVKKAAELLAGTDVKVCTVIGFPLGANTSEVKAYEVENAIKNGATEVDMVINIGALKGGNDTLVQSDIESVVAVSKGKALSKVIIETSLLTDDEKVRACELAKKAGADFVKTSTGFSTGGATLEDIKLMRATVGPEMGVKASGGVRTTEDAHQFIEAGATRLGSSNGLAIVEG